MIQRSQKNLVIIYSYGDFRAATALSNAPMIQTKRRLQISRAGCLPPNKVAVKLFQNPFADLEAAKTAPLKIDHALVSTVPSEQNVDCQLVCALHFRSMAFFAVGPGVCVWLALS